MATLVCVECWREVGDDDAAAGWRAYLGAPANEDEAPCVTVYCPSCARREFFDGQERKHE